MKPANVSGLTLFCLSILQVSNGLLTTKCIDAIQHASKGELKKCYFNDWIPFQVCGPFKIPEAYWIDCGRPGPDWMTCTKYLQCSIRCVRSFLRRYANWCVGWEREPVCKDYAMIWRGGSFGCQKYPDVFWAEVRQYCGGEHGCD